MSTSIYRYIFRYIIQKIFHVASKNAVIAIRWTLEMGEMSAMGKNRGKLTWN